MIAEHIRRGSFYVGCDGVLREVLSFWPLRGKLEYRAVGTSGKPVVMPIERFARKSALRVYDIKFAPVEMPA